MFEAVVVKVFSLPSLYAWFCHVFVFCFLLVFFYSFILVGIRMRRKNFSRIRWDLSNPWCSRGFDDLLHKPFWKTMTTPAMHSPGAGGAQVAVWCWGTPKEMEQVLHVVESFHPGWTHSECSSSWAVTSKPVNLRWSLLSETQLRSSKQAGLLSWGRGNLGTHSWGSKQVTKDFGYVLHLVLFGGCALRNIQEWCQKCDTWILPFTTKHLPCRPHHLILY